MVAANVTAHAATAKFVALRPRLEALATRITGDRDEAADIASEAYIALVERGPAEADDVAPWLFTTIRNRALNRVRDRARAARRVVPEAISPAPPAPANGRLTQLLAQAAHGVSRRDRTALQLRSSLGASYADVAAALGVTESNARLVVHRAERRFRRETVRLLADHHGVAAECRESLVESAVARRVPIHPGCNACVPVVDEVQALAANAAIPVVAVGALQRCLDRLAARIGPRVFLNDTAARLTEGAAVLVAAGTIVLGASPNAAVVPPAPADTASPTFSLGAIVGHLPLEAAGAAEDAVSYLGIGRPSAEGPEVVEGLVATAGGNARDDRPGDHAPITSPLASPVAAATPWAPRVVRDAFASEAGTGADMHRFEVATIADASGAPVGLRFTIDVDGPPSNDMGYTVRWGYLDTPCSSDRLTLSYATTRSGAAPEREAVWEHSCSADAGYESVEAAVPFSIVGSRVTLDLPFAAIPAEVTVAPGPGVVLGGVSVVAIDYQRPLSLVDGDRAPDDGGIDYSVEREPGTSQRQPAGTS